MKRLHGVAEDELMYAIDMAAEGKPLSSHLSARLARVNAGPGPDVATADNLP